MPISLEMPFAVGIELLEPRLEGAAERVALEDGIHQRSGVAAARGEALLHVVRLFPNETDIEHGAGG